MYVHIGIIGRDRTIQLSLALLVIVSDSITLGERAYNTHSREKTDRRLFIKIKCVSSISIVFCHFKQRTNHTVVSHLNSNFIVKCLCALYGVKCSAFSLNPTLLYCTAHFFVS